MGDVKPWQIVLFVAAVVVVGVSVGWMVLGGKGVKQVDAITLVDVRSGDLFTIDVSGRAAAIYPEKHPDTGEYTLLPVYRDDSGEWLLDPRARGTLEAIEGEKAALQGSSGRVVVSDAARRRIKAGA